jgi:putative endonuclease
VTQSEVQDFDEWWSRWDSNPRPPRCHRGALPTAPRPHRRKTASRFYNTSSQIRTRKTQAPPFRGALFPSPFFVYILESRTTGRYYVGQTKSVEERPAYHDANYSRSLRNRGPWKLDRCEEYATRSDVASDIKAQKDRRFHRKTKRRAERVPVNRGGRGFESHRLHQIHARDIAARLVFFRFTAGRVTARARSHQSPPAIRALGPGFS